jgi:hypothetical protein
MPKVLASAIRLCEACGREGHVNRIEGMKWADTQCPYCQHPYRRPITVGLDRVADPAAPGWPSNESIQKQRDAKWDAFVHPSKGRA